MLDDYVAWRAPITKDDQCHNPGADPDPYPASTTFVGLCQSGCYTPDQKLTFVGGRHGIKKALDKSRMDLVTLSPDSTLRNIVLMKNKVQSYMGDVASAQQTVLAFKMQSGGELHVTEEHPLVTADGFIKQAETLKVGESLITDKGVFDPIVSIEREEYYGKVYNVKPMTRDNVSNIVVAQGYLNGSSRYQNEDLEDLNRMVLRDTIPKELLPE